MKKSSLRFLGILVAAVMAVTLVACGGGSADPAEGVTIQNDLDVELEAFFISSTNSETWGESAIDSSIDAGSSTVIDDEALVEGNDVEYDVGALDDEDMVYEFYAVKVGVGYTMAISAGDSAPILTVTDASGATSTYEGYIYPYEG